MINKITGTQDFLDLTLYNFIIDQTRKHLHKHNFAEAITPILEPTELFQRSLGLNTDVVSKEMYTMGKDNEICLRPEITASTVRAFAENHVQNTPWKVFEHGPVFRHERPQKGRFREFHQMSMEVIGSSSMAQDALFIKMLDTLFAHTFKLDSYALQLNFLGTRQDRANHKQKLIEFLNKNINNICQTCKDRKDANTLRVFDCKNEACQKLYKDAPMLVDNLCLESSLEWEELKKHLDMLSVTYIETPTLVRGLDYYNKTVFEFVSTDLGAQNTFCGGGRYDHLVTEIGGGQDQPSVGAAFGIERVMLILEQRRNQLALPQQAKLAVVIPIEKEQETLALLVVDELTRHGICTDVFVDEPSMKSKMRKANKLGAHWAIIIGPDELAQKTAVLKNMITGTEEKVAQTALVAKLT